MLFYYFQLVNHRRSKILVEKRASKRSNQFTLKVAKDDIAELKEDKLNK